MRIRAMGMAIAMLFSSMVAVGVSTAPASAVTVKANAKCAKVGQKASVRSTQYVCTKSGTSAKWVVNKSTVRAGRGCTVAGELVPITTTNLMSCFKNSKTKRLVWKKATADCKEAYGIWQDLSLKYTANQSQLTRLETSIKTLPTDQQNELSVTIAMIKMNLQKKCLV